MKKFNCKTCGKENINTRSRPKKYCSRACANADPEVKAKIVESQKKTYDKKYGCHPMKTEATKNKQREVMLEKYGSKFAMGVKSIQKKSEETKVKLYGDPFYNNIEKGKKTKLNKYGNENYNGQRKKTIRAIDKKILEWEDIIILNYDPTKSIKNQLFKVKCVKCNSEWEGSLNSNYKPKCKFCSDKIKYIKISKGHQEIIDYIRLISPDIEIDINDRTTLIGDELDISLHKKKISIEFNGIFYHNSFFKTKDYHLKKTSRCLHRGITLIHIFDYLWWSKKDLIKSMISAKLGIFNKRLYARKCEIRLVKYDKKKVFLNENHLQGTANSSVNIGLYFENELVSILTLGIPRFDKKADWEIIRYASKQGVQVIGGFSKMLQYFIRNYTPKVIVTYCDRTWSSGETYLKSGFTFDSFTPPNYFYFKNLNVYPRQMFQKHKLNNILENFDPSKTEMENVLNNGYFMFWDCGNLKLYYNTSNTKRKIPI